MSFLCALSTYIVEMVSISAEIVHVRIVHWKFLQHVGTDYSLSLSCWFCLGFLIS